MLLHVVFLDPDFPSLEIVYFSMFQTLSYIILTYFNKYHRHWRQSGLKTGGAHTKYFRGGAEMWSMFVYIILERGRKSGVAHATAATPSLAPLTIGKC